MSRQLALELEAAERWQSRSRSLFRQPRGRAGAVQRLELALELTADELERAELQRKAGEIPERPWRGGLAWAAEVRRLATIMQCRSSHHRRFMRLCAQLTPWRLRSAVQCNAAAIEAILPLLEGMKRAGCQGIDVGPYGPHATGWTRSEFGELLVIARNRKLLLELGRDRPKPKGPRFAPELLPDARLLELIQSHPDLTIVDRLRAERQRRQELAR